MQVTRLKEKVSVKKMCCEHKVCVVSFVLLLMIWVIISIHMKYAPFGDNSLLKNDALHQYYPLFSQYRDRLLSGDGIGYSMGGGLGFSFYAIWTYYLSSPLNLLIVFVPTSQMDTMMNFLIILKIALSGTAFAWYLERKGNRDNYSIVPFAFGYALSSFVIGYCFNIMWLDCFVLFPLIVAGMEDLIEKKKWKLYVGTLALSLWCNFYISFMVCLFLVLWFLLYKHESIRSFFKRGISFAACSILSAGLACIVLIPAYLGLVQTGGTQISIPEFGWTGSFLEIFAGKEGGIFLFSDPVSVTSNNLANLYAGVFLFGLIILYFMAKEIPLLKKIKMGILVLLLVVSLNENVMNYIWHGFHDQVGIPNRFVFLLLFVALVMGFQAFQLLKTMELWKILLSSIIPMALCGCLYYLQPENVTIKMLVCTLIFIATYMVLEIFYSRKVDGTTLKKALILVMCGEIFANAFVGNVIQGGVSVSDYYRNPINVQKMANQLADEPYRAELANPTVINEGMAYNLSGVSIFSSMTNKDTIDLLHSIGFSSASNSYASVKGTPVLNTLFGIKNYLLIENDANRLDKEYVKSEELKGVTTYTKEEVLPIAYLCEDKVENWDSLDGDFFENQNDLLHLMTGNEYQVFTEVPYELTESNDVIVETLDERQQFSFLSAEGARDDHAVFESVMEKDQDLYLRIQARYADIVTVMINEKIIAYKDLSSSFYHVGEVKKGDTITVKIGLEEDCPTYGKISMSMYAYDAEVMQKAYTDLNEGAINITQWKEGHFKGSVEATDTRTSLFTTIPYEKGWSVLVDGKEQKVETVEGGFIMVSLDKGTHEIEFTYEVPGLKEGCMVSLGSMVILLLAVWYSRKNQKFK